VNVTFESRGKKFVLISDNNSYTVYTEGLSKKGEKTRTNPKYATTISGALNILLEESIKTSDAKTLKELKQDVVGLKNRIETELSL
jgi:hypothetical protein